MRILALGAHLDDIEIACGGTLARAVALGHEVKMVAMTHSGYHKLDGKEQRGQSTALVEGSEAASILGVGDLEVLNFPTTRLPYDAEVVQAIERIAVRFQPDIILTHWTHDTHQDHRNVALATLAAVRYYNSLLMYEPMMPGSRSDAAFRPQVYVDVSDYLEKKLRSIKAHKGEYDKYGEAWVKAIEARTRLRGYEMGRECAESFEVVRLEWELLRALPQEGQHSSGFSELKP